MENEQSTFPFCLVLFQGDIALDPRVQDQLQMNDKVSRELITGSDNNWPKIKDKVLVPYVIEEIGKSVFAHFDFTSYADKILHHIYTEKMHILYTYNSLYIVALRKA